LADQNVPEIFNAYSIGFDMSASERALDEHIDEESPEIFEVHSGENWLAWVAGAHTGIAHVIKLKREEARKADPFGLRRFK
jgi:hypothetical protein